MTCIRSREELEDLIMHMPSSAGELTRIGELLSSHPERWQAMNTVEHYCEVLHDAYEQAALAVGWETQEASRKPWSEVPELNKAVMRVAVSALLFEIEKERRR